MSTEDNNALSRSIFDGLSRNDVATVDELYTPGPYADHWLEKPIA